MNKKILALALTTFSSFSYADWWGTANWVACIATNKTLKEGDSFLIFNEVYDTDKVLDTLDSVTLDHTFVELNGKAIYCGELHQKDIYDNGKIKLEIMKASTSPGMVHPEAGKVEISFNGAGPSNDYAVLGDDSSWTLGLNKPDLKSVLTYVADEPENGTIYVTFHANGIHETAQLVPRSKITMNLCANRDGTGKSFCEYRQCYHNPVSCY